MGRSCKKKCLRIKQIDLTQLFMLQRFNCTTSFRSVILPYSNNLLKMRFWENKPTIVLTSCVGKHASFNFSSKGLVAKCPLFLNRDFCVHGIKWMFFLQNLEYVRSGKGWVLWENVSLACLPNNLASFKQLNMSKIHQDFIMVNH